MKGANAKQACVLRMLSAFTSFVGFSRARENAFRQAKSSSSVNLDRSLQEFEEWSTWSHFPRIDRRLSGILLGRQTSRNTMANTPSTVDAMFAVVRGGGAAAPVTPTQHDGGSLPAVPAASTATVAPLQQVAGRGSLHLLTSTDAFSSHMADLMIQAARKVH